MRLLGKHPRLFFLLAALVIAGSCLLLFGNILKPTVEPKPTVKISPYVLTKSLSTGRPTITSSDSKNPRLQLKGVTVWALPNHIDEAHDKHAQSQWANRKLIISTVASWGANTIRFRVDAVQYNRMDQIDKDDYLIQLKELVDLASSRSMYTVVCFWDIVGMDDQWISKYPAIFRFVRDSLKVLGADNPWVVYEPAAEPHGSTWKKWTVTVVDIIKHFRDYSYHGVLIIGTIDYDIGYDDAAMSKVEKEDAKNPGMNGKAQIAFGRADYAGQITYKSTGRRWSEAVWLDSLGGAQQNHLIIVTEFGNEVLPGSQNEQWSKGATTFFGGPAFKLPWYGGGIAFIQHWPYGHPGNSMTDPSGNFTVWGNLVYHNFFQR